MNKKFLAAFCIVFLFITCKKTSQVNNNDKKIKVIYSNCKFKEVNLFNLNCPNLLKMNLLIIKNTKMKINNRYINFTNLKYKLDKNLFNIYKNDTFFGYSINDGNAKFIEFNNSGKLKFIGSYYFNSNYYFIIEHQTTFDKVLLTISNGYLKNSIFIEKYSHYNCN